MRFGRMKRVIVGVANDIGNNHIFAFAAALSYYFVLAFFPALIALAALSATFQSLTCSTPLSTPLPALYLLKAWD